jgi:hypothetical protein
VSQAYLDQSDIFIGYYWQRYGHVGHGMDVSGAHNRATLVVLAYEAGLVRPRADGGWTSL